MRRRSRHETLKDLPEGHLLVLELLIQLDRGQGVPWQALCEAAAQKGIGERELHIIMHGAAPADADAGA